MKLFAPEDLDVELTESTEEKQAEETEAVILSWQNLPRTYSHGSLIELIARSRAVYHNRRCRDCGRPTVEPIELDDAILSKNRTPIPGSATLVGFHCQSCHSEWKA